MLDSDGHLVTLTGAGGCGKTRLAIDAATELVSIFPDGVWLVELAPLGDPTLLPHVIGAALGVRERPDRSVRQSVIDHLASRELLLVLDNCEHLVEACAELADPLLQSCPGLRILATPLTRTVSPGRA